MAERKARARAFVPKMTIRRAVAGVLPACALAAASELAACEQKQQVIVLAMMAFDAAVDVPPSSASPLATGVVIALAVVAFDAGIDPPSTAADGGARAGKRRPLPHR